MLIAFVKINYKFSCIIGPVAERLGKGLQNPL